MGYWANPVIWEIPAMRESLIPVSYTHLNISDYRSDTLPDNLMDLNTIFDRVLLAPYKEKKDVENFRKLWNLSLIHISPDSP